MVINVTSLLKTVKAVEDEHTRGTRALEATIEAIAQEIRVSSNAKHFSYAEMLDSYESVSFNWKVRKLAFPLKNSNISRRNQ
jgi:hypothetical protein